MIQGMTAQDWPRVAERVKARRNELHLTQVQAADRAGFGELTWGKIEKGAQSSYRTGNLVGLCKALGWTVDSIDRIHAGAEPELVGASASVLDAIADDSRLDEDAKEILISMYQRFIHQAAGRVDEAP